MRAAAVLLLALAAPARATTWTAGAGGLARATATTALGRVESARAAWDGPRIVTTVTATVEEVVAGRAPERLTFTFEGGTVGGVTQVTSGAARVTAGERAVVVLSGDGASRRLVARVAPATTPTPTPRAAEPAAAVRARTTSGTPLTWRRACPRLLLSVEEHPTIGNDELRALFAQAMQGWLPAGCSAMPLEVRAGAGDGRRVGWDGANAVIWRAPDYCDDAAHAAEEICLSPNALAVTRYFYYDDPGAERDGELIEADIELNLAAGPLGTDGGPATYDLPSVLTHELGHALGFDHTCNSVPGRAAPLDDRQRPIPGCFPTLGLEPTVVEATMFPFVDLGETFRRTPEAQERAAACDAYRDHDGTCEVIAPLCGCRAGGAGGLGAAIVLLFAYATLRGGRP
jgi:hypothetical protein